MGPASWENIKAFASGEPRHERMYVSLYGVESMTGRLEIGPFEMASTSDLLGATDDVRPAVRMDIHRLPPDLVVDGELAKTDAKAYHGGDMSDEVAALLSLSLRARCRTGGRWWSHGIEPDACANPFFVDRLEPTSPLASHSRDVLPGLLGAQDVSAAEAHLRRYSALPGSHALALVKAARQYQLGVWVANEDPNLAWLRLVSAIEVASQTLKMPKVTHLERVQDLLPAFAATLGELDPEVAEGIAHTVSSIVGSTRRFLAFFDRFCPEPPMERPAVHDQVDWAALPETLKLIYGYRSKALHEGRPFPAPMCEAPRAFDSGVGIERPLGLSAAAYNASWMKGEYPMLLAMFEYLVHGALLNWWEHLSSS